MAKDIQPLKKLSENSKDKKYQIVFTSRFKKAWNKYSRSGKYRPEKFYEIIRILASGDDLNSSYRDHELKGDMSGFRECHIEFDLLVIYKIEGWDLKFINFGTHPELFG